MPAITTNWVVYLQTTVRTISSCVSGDDSTVGAVEICGSPMSRNNNMESWIVACLGGCERVSLAKHLSCTLLGGTSGAIPHPRSSQSLNPSHWELRSSQDIRSYLAPKCKQLMDMTSPITAKMKLLQGNRGPTSDDVYTSDSNIILWRAKVSLRCSSSLWKGEQGGM